MKTTEIARMPSWAEPHPGDARKSFASVRTITVMTIRYAGA